MHQISKRFHFLYISLSCESFFCGFIVEHPGRNPSNSLSQLESDQASFLYPREQNAFCFICEVLHSQTLHYKWGQEDSNLRPGDDEKFVLSSNALTPDTTRKTRIGSFGCLRQGFGMIHDLQGNGSMMSLQISRDLTQIYAIHINFPARFRRLLG
jgi:hypothetical protein